jgi:hypothetical protein
MLAGRRIELALGVERTATTLEQQVPARRASLQVGPM